MTRTLILCDTFFAQATNWNQSSSTNRSRNLWIADGGVQNHFSKCKAEDTCCSIFVRWQNKGDFGCSSADLRNLAGLQALLESSDHAVIFFTSVDRRFLTRWWFVSQAGHKWGKWRSNHHLTIFEVEEMWTRHTYDFVAVPDNQGHFW